MITTDHKLLTNQWTCDVETVERAIGRMSEHPSRDVRVVTAHQRQDVRIQDVEAHIGFSSSSA